MKDSRLNYKVKRPKNKDFEGERVSHYANRHKIEQRNKEVRDIDKIIRTRDYKALLQEDI